MSGVAVVISEKCYHSFEQYSVSTR